LEKLAKQRAQIFAEGESLKNIWIPISNINSDSKNILDDLDKASSIGVLQKRIAYHKKWMDNNFENIRSALQFIDDLDKVYKDIEDLI
jgi:hypothetical protein